MPAEPAVLDRPEPRHAPLAARMAGRRALFLMPRAAEPCGVGDFAGHLAAAMEARCPGRTASLALGRTGRAALQRRTAEADALVLNLPVVAWKPRPLAPILALARFRARTGRIIVILHEWGGLHPLRRLALIPALVLADRILLLSPHIRDELGRDPLVGRLAASARLIPLAPTLARPPAVRPTPLSRALAAARAEGRLVLGAFGSIYPGKRPTRLLDIAAVLRRRGHRPLVLQAGGFVPGHTSVEAEYWERARALGLQDDVTVTGFMGGAAELYGVLDEVDAFAYDFAEGLTARRSSVLASLQTRRPVVTTAPACATEFAHHPRFQGLIDGGALTFAPIGADADAFADAILAALNRPAPPRLDVAAWWRDTAEAAWAEIG